MNASRVSRGLVLFALLGTVRAGAQEPGERVGSPTPVRGESGVGLEVFDRVMFDLLERHRIAGGSLSIAKDGRLVYAKGFGWADIRNRVPAGPQTLFGMASVSKAITGMTILALIDDGKLQLDDYAFRILDDLKPPPGARPDPRTRDITIRQLLYHESGYTQQPNRQEAARLFRVDPADLTSEQTIRYMLGRPLDYDPGTEAHYSNFGFIILGQVIEEIADADYDQFVQRRTFARMGIRHARLGTWDGRYPPGEAHRYGPRGAELAPLEPFPGNAAGGWSASTIEMVKFLTSVDGTRGESFLSSRMRKAMLAAPPPPVEPRKNGTHFGLGWDVVRTWPNGVSYMKNGMLPGIRAVIGHMPGNVDWCVAFNGGTTPQGDHSEDAEALKEIQQSIQRTRTWPDVDLFPNFPE